MAKEGIFRVEYMPGENFRDYDLLFIERKEFDTLEEAREEARRRLGDLDDWRKSPPRFEWNDPHGPTYEFVEMYRCGRGHGSNFVMISRRELRPVPPKLRERVIEGPKRKHGTLQLQPSGRWAVCRPGRRPVEIMSDEFGSRSAAS